jgi:hypothetical protein
MMTTSESDADKDLLPEHVGVELLNFSATRGVALVKSETVPTVVVVTRKYEGKLFQGLGVEKAEFSWREHRLCGEVREYVQDRFGGWWARYQADRGRRMRVSAVPAAGAADGIPARKGYQRL